MTILCLAYLFCRTSFVQPNISSQRSSSPSIAILPVLNTAGEKWQELKDRQRAKGDEYLADEFGKRGFAVVNAATVKSDIEQQKLDLTDEEQQKRETLYGIADRLHADYVVFVVITNTDQKLIQQILASKREGWADIKVWLLDAAHHTQILSAKTLRGNSGGGFFAGVDKGSDRQVQAVVNGLRDALKDFFKPFPVVSKN
jgi:hypothetical protein